MPLNNRIYRFSCDTCKRSIERFADARRPDPLGCVITDKCDGKLSLTATRFGLRPKNTKAAFGLTERSPRGAVTSTSVTTNLDKVSLASFAGGVGMTIALVNSAVTTTQRIFYVNSNGIAKVLERTSLTAPVPVSYQLTAVFAELSSSSLAYKSYTYVKADRALYVEGADDSASKAVLTINDSSLKVYVNGVLLASTLYTASTSRITFTPELTGEKLIIEVYAYKSTSQLLTSDNARRLTFTALPLASPLRTACSWGDADVVNQLHLAYCSDLSPLDKAKSYKLIRFETVDELQNTVVIDPQGIMLLADPPYAFQDKRLTSVISLPSLQADVFPISFIIDPQTGLQVPAVEGEVLSPRARPLAFNKLALSSDNDVASPASITRAEKAFIIGPA